MSGQRTGFLTVERASGPEESREKGSRFISFLFPVGSRGEAEAIVAGLRKQYHDATHVCFAFRLGEGEEHYFRHSDDGEPSGTAGLPIYNEIKGMDFLNALVAVVRYFGGTKLGTGGLTRAYGRSARMVLEAASPVFRYVRREVSLSFPFHFTGEAMQVVNRFSLEIVGQDYTPDGVSMTLSVPVEKLKEVEEAISHRSGGRFKLGLKGQ